MKSLRSSLRLPAKGLAALSGLNVFLALTLSLGSIQFYYAYYPHDARLTLCPGGLDMWLWLASALPLMSASMLYAYREGMKRWLAALAVSSAVVVAVFSAWLRGLALGYFQLISTVFAAFLILREVSDRRRWEALNIFLIGFLAPPIIVGASSAVARLLILVGLLPSEALSRLLEADLGLFYLGYPVEVPLLLAVIYAWLWIWLLRSRFDGRALLEEDWGSIPSLLLGGSLILGTFTASLPYMVDPSYASVDAEWYLSTLSQMGRFDPAVLLMPRGLYVALLKAASTGLGVGGAVKIGPLILSLFHILVVYILTSNGWGRYAGAMASMFAALTFPAMVSLYAGVYANWLTLSLVVLSFYLFAKAVEERSRLKFILCLLLLASGLLNHPWTGGIALAVYVAMPSAALLAGDHVRHRDTLRYGGALIAFFLLAGLASILLGFRAPLAGFNALNALNPWNLPRLPLNLSHTLRFYVGGFLNAPPFYFLAMFGAAASLKARGAVKPFIPAWLMVCSLLVTFSSQWIMWRILLLAPFQILAGVGVSWLASTLGKLYSRPWIGLSITLLTSFTALNYALRCIELF